MLQLDWVHGGFDEVLIYLKVIIIHNNKILAAVASSTSTASVAGPSNDHKNDGAIIMPYKIASLFVSSSDLRPITTTTAATIYFIDIYQIKGFKT